MRDSRLDRESSDLAGLGFDQVSGMSMDLDPIRNSTTR